MVLGHSLPRGHVLVKIGMLSDDKWQGQKFTLLSRDLLKPWDAIRDGRDAPLNSLRECLSWVQVSLA